MSAEGLSMRSLHLTPWRIISLVCGFIIVMALAAVALVLGKEAVIATALILLICASVVRWLLDF
jgi:hypothetical protein